MRACLSVLPLLFVSPTWADGPPIWVLTDTPSPLPIVRLVPGEEARVSLFKSTRHAGVRVAEALTDGGIDRVRDVDGDAVTFRALADSSGFSIIRVTLEGDDGARTEVALPVVIEALPIIGFAYEGTEGEPSRVALAGSFNGWSDAADLMTPDEDGVFRISKPIHPGTYTYKFVVDGEWTTDPSNPETDGSGFGNSVLRVEGDVAGTFDWNVLSAIMPGGGTQGALHTSALLDEETVTVIVNNQLQESGAWSYDPVSGILQLHVPEEQWLDSNFVTVLGESADGRRGAITVPFASSRAARSPHEEIIYFPMTDRFYDGDPSNNPPRNLPKATPITEYHGGDWAGITQKLKEGYFTDLGITTLWISPPNENTPKLEQESVPPGNYFKSYHGYWPTSFTETNPPFGTMDELRGLVAAAHERDIAVLLDFVSNHVHEDHPLFQEDPSIAVPLQLPNGEDNIRRFNEHPFTTWFDTFLPTLDYEGRPDLIPIMTDSALYWLQETNADGFRHDAVKHVPLEFWRELTRRIHHEMEIPQARRVYQVGETISGHADVAAFVGPDLLDGQFDFPAYFAIQNVIARGEGAMTDLAQALRDGERIYPPSAIMSPLLGNHDMGRFMAYADGDLPPGVDEGHIAFHDPPEVDHPESYTRIQFGFAFLTALPGPPTIYYGDEIGMTGASDPDNRRFMQWEDWSDLQQATHGHVAALNHLRRESIALRRGALQILHADEESLVIARIAPVQVVVAAQMRRPMDEAISIELPAFWKGVNLNELAAEGVTLEANSQGLTASGSEWSWGFWEATW